MILKRHRLLQQPNQVRQTFDKSYFLHLKHQELLEDAKARLRNQHKKEDFQQLEDLLNGLYKRNQEAMKQYNLSKITMNAVQEATKNFIEEQVKKAQFNEGDFQFKSIGLVEHEKRIYINTIKSRAKLMDEALNNPAIVAALVKNNNKTIIRDIKTVIRDMKKFFEEDEILSDSLKLVKSEYTVRRTSQTKELIDDFDRYYQLLRNLSSNSTLADIYGQAWEKTLTVFNDLVNKKTKQTVRDVIANAFSEKTLGSKSAYRGQLESNIFDEEIYGEKQKKIKRYFDSTKEDEIITIRSFDEKSGKADVLFKLPTVESDFKISAKSWGQYFNQHTFNETSLFDALIRTSNLDYTLAYGLVVGYYNPVGQLYDWVQAHEFAKMCIFLDTVMGYSQKNNWVDTIVIENRGNKETPVSVYSIRQILEKPLKMWSPYINYDPKTLNLRYIKSSEWWLKKIQSQMHSIKVSVSQGILNLAKF